LLFSPITFVKALRGFDRKTPVATKLLLVNIAARIESEHGGEFTRDGRDDLALIGALKYFYLAIDRAATALPEPNHGGGVRQIMPGDPISVHRFLNRLPFM